LWNKNLSEYLLEPLSTIESNAIENSPHSEIHGASSGESSDDGSLEEVLESETEAAQTTLCDSSSDSEYSEGVFSKLLKGNE
jgi:hypothetical protein